jgi:hypothetical protein
MWRSSPTAKTLLTSDPGDLSRLLDALAVAPLLVRV